MKEHVERMVRVYELVNPELLKKHERNLKELFFQVLRIPKASSIDYYFSVDEKSGWIVFKNKKYLFRESSSPSLIPASKTDAIKVAADWLQQLSQALGDPKRYPFTKELSSTAIVPTQVREIDVVAVPHPEHDHIDHLLCRLQPFLAVSDEGRDYVPVLGSQIDMRLGHQNQLISYSARWSPLTGKIIRRGQWHLEDLLATHHDEEHHESTEPEYKLMYVQDNFAKRGLAPYYFGVKGGHHGGFLPACDHSLLIGFTQELSISGVKCAAFGVSGSGSFTFQWYGWRPDTIFVEEGVHDFGTAETIEVPIAVWNMILIVHDTKFGITAEHQEMVYPTTLQNIGSTQHAHA